MKRYAKSSTEARAGQLDFGTELPRSWTQPADNLPEAFRRIYYHLYTNGRTSRAERLVEDLSLILLAKLAIETNGGQADLDQFMAGKSASAILLPLLRRTYPTLVDEKQTFSLSSDTLRTILEDLRPISLSAAPAHILGEAFQALMGPRLRGDKGQFFTPLSLVRAMVEILAPRPDEDVLDPACGTGGFLAEVHAYQSSSMAASEPSGKLLGVDKDQDLARLASALLHIVTRGRGTVSNFNSFEFDQWSVPSGTTDETLFDVILTNPPFGARIGVREQRILKTFSLGNNWIRQGDAEIWHETSSVMSAQDPQTLFLELCVRKLKPGGRLGIVLPEGLFGNRTTGYVWQWLKSHGQIIAMLDCPRTTFQPGTDTKTNVLFFERASKPTDPDAIEPHVWVGVALHCGHDRRGRTRRTGGELLPDDLSALGRSYASRAEPDSGWVSAAPLRSDYLVPRYYAKRPRLGRQEAELTRGAVWRTVGDLVEDGLVVIRKGHEVGSEAYGTGDIPFVRTSDLSNFEIKVDSTVAISEETYRSFASQQRLKAGDILLVVDGRYRIGSTAILTDRNCRCVVQSHLRILTINQHTVLEPHELLFALALPSIRQQIRNLVFVQSTLGTLGRRLLELEVPLLHGPGPWQQSVKQFTQVLEERDSLLGDLRAMTGPEFDL